MHILLHIYITSSSYWPEYHVRNANVSDVCGYDDGLVFSSITSGQNDIRTESRSLLTQIFNLTSNLSSYQFGKTYKTMNTSVSIQSIKLKKWKQI